MEILSVVIAAVATFAFGAVWYMSLAKQWLAAAEIKLGPDGRPARAADRTPFVIGFLCMVLAAGMMRHVFGMAAIDSLGKGLVAGLGIGAFTIMPWLAMNYAFGQRKLKLAVIDGGNVVIGSAIMGAVLGAM